VKSPVVVLGALLLVQCAVVALVYWPEEPRQGIEAPGPLVNLRPEAVAEIHVADDLGNEIVLENRGGRWVMVETDGLPADSQKVATLLRGVSQPRPAWPVATTAPARQRFQVADYHYQRRIILIGEEQLLGTVYLGTSPGFRKVHARADRQQEVFSIDFSNHDAPATPEPWLDLALMQMRVPVSVTTDAYDIRREGDQWVSGWGETPDQRELMAVLDSLENLQVAGLAGEEVQRDLAAAEPELTLHADSLSGPQSLELYRLDGEFYIHSSRFTPFFGLSEYEYQKLAGIDAGRMMGGAPAQAGGEADAESGELVSSPPR
jgi:hypothetical protein